MKRLLPLLLIVFLVPACFGGDEEEQPINEEEQVENGQEANGEEATGVVEYLDCELLDTNIQGEFSIKFVDEKIDSLKGTLYAEGEADIPNAEQAYALFEQELKRNLDDIDNLDYSLTRDANVITVDIDYDFTFTDAGAQGYYVYLIEEEMYIPENIPMENVKEEVVSEQITCEHVE